MLDASGSSDLFQSDSSNQYAISSYGSPPSSKSNRPPSHDLADLLDARLLRSLADSYFLDCHQQPYSYFHESTFRQALEDETLPSYMILAFAATAIRFSSEPAFAGRQSEVINWYAKKAWAELIEQSFSDTQDLTIRAVQAASLLGIIDHVGKYQFLYTRCSLV